jgi:TRAP-type C4-dicarboxylate transport system permease small subunit
MWIHIKTFLAFIPKLMDRAVAAAGYIGAFLLVTTAVLIGYAVTVRYGFRAAPVWGELIAGACLLWVILLVAAWTLREEGHTRVDVVTHLLRPKVRAVLFSITNFLGIIASWLFCWESVKRMVEDFSKGTYIISAWTVDFPRGILFVGLALGTFLLGWQFVRKFQGCVRELIACKNNGQVDN